MQITSGPFQVDEGGSGTWTAEVYGGSGSYGYIWSKRRRNGAPWYETCAGSTTSCTATYSEDADGTNDAGGIRLIVTDLAYGTSDTHSRPVTIVDHDEGGGNCDGPTTNIICPLDPATAHTAGHAAGQATLPEEFALEGSFPNPVQAGTRVTIPFALPEAAEVRLAVYDMLGREVRRIEGGTVGAGYPRAVVGTEGLSSGVYVYRLTAGEQFTDTGKLVVVK